MTSAGPRTRKPAPARTPNSRLYWIATGLFCLLFTISVALTVLDPGTTRAIMQELGFPGYLMYPQAIAKALGVIAILSRRSRTLTDLAFAGFLYDLLLALSAHIAERQSDVLLAAIGLALWAAAFWADRTRFPRAPGY